MLPFFFRVVIWADGLFGINSDLGISNSAFIGRAMRAGETHFNPQVYR